MWFDQHNIKCVGRRVINIIERIKNKGKTITIDLDKSYVLKIYLNRIEIKTRNKLGGNLE